MKTSKMRIFLLSLALVMVMTSFALVNALAADDNACAACGEAYNNGFCSTADCAGAYQPAEQNANGYYEIGNAGQLYWFAALVKGGETSANAVLTDDITVNENVLNTDGSLNGDGSNFRAWTPIGNSYSNYYKGTFDGDKFAVKGLYYNDTTTSYVGLFGSLGGNGKVQNLGVEESYLCGKDYVGGVVGFGEGIIASCYNTGTVSGNNYVGGVVGLFYDNVTNCYNTGTVSGGIRVGGVAGECCAVNCYNTGAVSGRTLVGAVVGDFYDLPINCYYLSDSETDSFSGTTFKTAEQFASGEVTYLLNGDQSTIIWRQTIDTDDIPVFATGSNQVYYWDCPDRRYSNSPDNNGGPEHDWVDGFCICGASEAPVQITEENFSYFGFTEETYTPYIDYYAIKTANHLYWFATEVGSGNTAINAVLIDNITVNENVLVDGALNPDSAVVATFRHWVPIGNRNNAFTGTFDGNNKTISGLYFAAGDIDYVGLFGYVGNGGTVKKVGIEDTYLFGSNYVGGVVGSLSAGTVTSCYTMATVSGHYCVGGVVGCLYTGTVTSCYNMGAASSSNVSVPAGDVVGEKQSGTVTSCYYLSDHETDSLHGTCFKTSAQFASGEVAYLLNGDQSTIVWGQTIGTDQRPVFAAENNRVYFWDCPYMTYKNEEATVETGHRYENGACVACGVLEKVTEANYLKLGFTDETYTAYLGYYAIQNADHLYWFAAEVRSGNTAINAVLTANITVNENVLVGGALNSDSAVVAAFRQWTPIGPWNNPYIGTFDGNNRTISGLYFNDGYSDNVGLFRYIGKTGVVKNVGIEDSYLYAFTYVCGVAVFNDGTVTNCYNTGIVSGARYVGGVVASNHGNVTNCYNTGIVSGGRYVGGVVGEGDATNCYNMGNVSGHEDVGGVVGEGDATNCYNMGIVSGTAPSSSTPPNKIYYQNVGGVVGSGSATNCYNTSTVNGEYAVGGVVGFGEGIIASCYNTGTVSSNNDEVGGVVGYLSSGVVTNCYNTGTVSRTVSGNNDDVGGVVGYLSSGVVINCYNTGTVSGDSHVGGVVGWNEGTVTDCYNTGAVSGTSSVGGVVGVNYGAVTNCYNTGAVSGTSSVGGVVGRKSYYNDTSTVTNSFYLDKVDDFTNPGGIDGADVVGQAEAKTLAQFKSGEVAWLLQNGVEETSEGTPLVWGQNLDNGLPEDSYPVFANNNQVYPVVDCGGYVVAYSNNPDGHVLIHHYSNGFCYCGAYQPAVWNEVAQHYEIYNAGQLYWFAALINGDTAAVPDIVRNTSANGVLMNDTVVNIDVLTENGALNGDGTNFRTWTPIGNGEREWVEYYDEVFEEWFYYERTIEYTGHFDGQGFTISGLCYNSEADHVGLFGIVGYEAEVKNLGVEDSYIHGTDFSGGVVGENYGNVTNCYNTGDVSASSDVGGVVGCNVSTVTHCYNIGTVGGEFDVGGATGYNLGTVTSCYNMGTVSGESDVGGVVGCNDGDVTNCYYLYMIGYPANPSSIAETDVAGQVEGKDLEQFISGEVTYLLNGDQTSIGFGQIIGTDPYPVFYNGENRVYFGSFCPALRESYANVPAPAPEVATEHTFENVTCIYCGLNVYDYAVELEERIAALEAALEALETQHGADIAALQQQLDDLLAELNEIKQNYATNEDVEDAVARIAALETKVAELEASVAANAEAIAKLEKALEELQKAMEDKDSELAEKIKALEEVLAAVEKAYKDADAALEEKLTALINEAKAELEAAIEELAARVTANESDIADLKAALELLQDKISTELLAKMEELIATLETVYATKEELATAVEELWAAINSGSEDLVQKIEKLRTTLNAAIAANNATAIELTEQINKAKSALQSALNKLEADLEQAKLELYAAIIAGDADLDEKIAALQAALDAAIVASDAADGSLKQELSEAVAILNAADEAIKAELTAKADELAAKADKLNTLVIVAIVIASVAMAGCTGLVTYIIIEKRKLIK